MRIEDSDIKQKISKLERENELLKHKIEELDKVSAENEELKKENAQLKDRIKELECVEESLHKRLEKLYIEKVELKKRQNPSKFITMYICIGVTY